MPPILGKIYWVCSTILTFSVHCVLINWPACFCPTGFQGYRGTMRWKSYKITFLITGNVKRVWSNITSHRLAETQPHMWRRMLETRTKGTHHNHKHLFHFEILYFFLSTASAGTVFPESQLIQVTNICPEFLQVISTTGYQQEAGTHRHFR